MGLLREVDWNAVALGLPIGIAIGISLGNVVLGVAIGIGFACAFASERSGKQPREGGGPRDRQGG